MGRSLFVDVAMKVTGSSELGAAAGTLDRMGLAGGKATAALGLVGVGAGLAGIAGLRMGDDYDAATDLIRSKTGQTGESLAGLEQSFKNVAGRVKEDIGTVSSVMSELAQRTGLTGPALEDLTQRVIEFSRVTGTDATENTALITRLFGDWSIATEDQAGTLDELMRASQATGLEVDDLMSTVVQFGAPLRLLGFSLEESAAMLGKWEKEGVNTDTMLTGLKFAVKSLAAEGVPASDMAATLRDRIKSIGDSADPVSESMKLFGLRAGADLAAAIKEGRFSIDDLVDTIENGGDTVKAAAADTRDFGDGISELKNQIATAIGPITDDFAGLADSLGNAIFLLPAVTGAVGSLTGALWAKVAAAAAANGGWATYLKTLGPSAGILGAVGIGLVGVNEGLNKSNEMVGQARTELSGMSATQIETAASTEVLGFRLGDIANGFSEFVGIAAPWHELSDSTAAFAVELNTTAESANKMAAQAQRGSLIASESAERLEREAVPAFTSVAGAGDDLGVALGRDLPREAERGMDDVADAAAELPGDMASRLRSGRDAWKGALDLLKDDLDSSMKRGKEIARLEAALTGEAITKGLASKDPIVRAQAQATVDLITSRLNELKGSAGDIGASFVDRFTAAIRAGRSDVAAAINYSFGSQMRGQSPPREGPLRDIGRWAVNVAHAFLDPFSGTIRRGLDLGQLQMGGAGSLAFAGGGHAAGAGIGGRESIVINVTAGVGDPVAIGREITLALRAYQRASGSE